MSDPESVHIPGWDQLVAAGRVPAAKPEVLAAARLAVSEAIRYDTSGTGGARVVPVTSASSGRRRSWTLRLALTGMVAAAAVAAVTIVQPAGSVRTSRPPVAAANAATFLRSVAYEQSARTDDWGSAPYWTITSTRVAADGSRVGRQELLAHYAGNTSHLRVTSPVHEDKAAPGPGRFSIGTRRLTWDQLDKLPTDKAALRTQLVSYANPGQDQSVEIFTVVGDLLDSPASPGLRGALYQVAADLPGVRLVGKVTDSTGRPGTAVELGDGKITVRYVVDPADGQLLETVVTAAQDLPAVPEAKAPRPLSVLDGVTQGLNAPGGRPALRAGAVVELTTFLTVGPARTANG
ncbi:hypothetical protein ABIA33_003911 [Streptacidiphilus sp. MAP12-16]|uniref:CU044_5270 family protein n=1 Tax=Streptacidiphilus sp. MAP12-16 TaxID=3156300 RepID=UPI0035110D55